MLVGVPLKALAGFDKEDTITIHELSRTLRRKPIEMTEAADKLARYVIEPREVAQVVVNEMQERTVEHVISQLSTLVGTYAILDQTAKERVKQSVSAVRH